MLFFIRVMIFLLTLNGRSRSGEVQRRFSIFPWRSTRFSSSSMSAKSSTVHAALPQHLQMSRRLDADGGRSSGYWQNLLLKRPTNNSSSSTKNTSFPKSISSFLTGLPSYLTLSSGIKRYPVNPEALSTTSLQYGNQDENSDELIFDEYSMQYGPVRPTRKLSLPIVNGPSLESDEDDSDELKIPVQRPSMDPESHQIHRHKLPYRGHNGSSEAPAPRPNKNAQSDDGPIRKHSSMGYGKPYYPPPPAPILPIVAGNPAKIVNPYINIAFNPEINMLGMRIQKQFGLHLGMKIVRPVRRPFSFLTPLIGGAISPAVPPPNYFPLPGGIPPRRPVPPGPYYPGLITGGDEQDIIISRRGESSATTSNTEITEGSELSLLDKIRLKGPLGGVEGRE